MLIVIKLLIRLNLLRFFNLSYKLPISGNKIKIPIINGMGKENLILSESWMTKVIKQLFALKKGIFVDVGVNVGQTLIKVRSVDMDVNYIGFEPNPACVYYVNELIRLNSLRNTVVVPVGISDVNQLLTLNFYSDGVLDSSASIVENFRPQKVYRREYVACLESGTFNNLFHDEPVSILKIDVEGAELEVLRSLFTFINKNRPFILIEILPVYSKENIDRYNRQLEIQKLLKELNYNILRINKSDLNFLKLHELEVNPRIEDCDYLLCPDEFDFSENS